MADTAIGRSEFLAAWKDHLPESWRDEVALSKLPVCWSYPDLMEPMLTIDVHRMTATNCPIPPVFVTWTMVNDRRLRNCLQWRKTLLPQRRRRGTGMSYSRARDDVDIQEFN